MVLLLWLICVRADQEMALLRVHVADILDRLFCFGWLLSFAEFARSYQETVLLRVHVADILDQLFCFGWHLSFCRVCPILPRDGTASWLRGGHSGSAVFRWPLFFAGFDRADQEMALLLGHVADILDHDSPACLKVNLSTSFFFNSLVIFYKLFAIITWSPPSLPPPPPPRLPLGGVVGC